MTPVRIEREQLPDCLAVMAQGYEESAQRFGMTEENCPYRGRTRLPLEVLEREFETGQIYGAFAQGRLVGVLSLQRTGDVLMINDLVVLPCWQGQGIGGRLLSFALETAGRLGCRRVRLGMVHDNLRLRRWYEAHGFRTVEVRRFEAVRYGVGRMELALRPQGDPA